LFLYASACSTKIQFPKYIHIKPECDTAVFLVDASVLEEHAASVFRAKLIMVRVMSGHTGSVTEYLA
jgi:hypothetical protein